MDPVRELKIRAEILHTQVAAGNPESLARLRALPELRRADLAALAAAAGDLRLKHCLAVLARECGFSSWAHARRVFDGDPNESDFGVLLYGTGFGASGMLNHWFARYDEARAFLDDTAVGGRRYLLGYKRSLFVADRPFVDTLGLDPDDEDWEAIEWDWIRPRAYDARRRLYQKRLVAIREAQ